MQRFGKRVREPACNQCRFLPHNPPHTMRILLTAFLCIGLAACTQTDAPTDADTTGVVIPETEPEVSLVAEQLVGRWANQNGTYVDFRGDGTLGISGRDQRDLSFRVLGDSLVVSDSTILAVETIPAENRYFIQTLTENELVLEPSTSALGGSYIRDAMPADSVSM